MNDFKKRVAHGALEEEKIRHIYRERATVSLSRLIPVNWRQLDELRWIECLKLEKSQEAIKSRSFFSFAVSVDALVRKGKCAQSFELELYFWHF